LESFAQKLNGIVMQMVTNGEKKRQSLWLALAPFLLVLTAVLAANRVN